MEVTGQRGWAHIPTSVKAEFQLQFSRTYDDVSQCLPWLRTGTFIFLVKPRYFSSCHIFMYFCRAANLLIFLSRSLLNSIVGIETAHSHNETLHHHYLIPLVHYSLPPCTLLFILLYGSKI